MESKAEELREEFNVATVRSSDKKMAKASAGVMTSPGLTFYKGGQRWRNFEGDLSDADSLVDFLTSEEALNVPDRIERVNAARLDKIVKEKTFVAVLFREFK